MLVIPVGSTEQHGPHLPLDTNTRIATAVARAVIERLATGQCLLAPAIGYGASGEHQGFAGTVSIGTAALRLLLVEFGRSASSWASRLVFVNGHGGNVEALVAGVAQLRYEAATSAGLRVARSTQIPMPGIPKRPYRAWRARRSGDCYGGRGGAHLC